MRGVQKPGFFLNTSLLPADLVKNPVSLSDCVAPKPSFFRHTSLLLTDLIKNLVSLSKSLIPIRNNSALSIDRDRPYISLHPQFPPSSRHPFLNRISISSIR